MKPRWVALATLALVGLGPAAAQSPLATNLGQLSDFAGEWPFVDQFKTSRPWVDSQRYGCGYWQCNPAPGLDLDENGWVRSLDTTQPNGGQVARTILYTYPNGAQAPADWHPLGTFVVLYDGEGRLEYGGSGARNDAASAPGRDVVEVSSSAPLLVTLVETNPANYLRNIRVLPPGGICADDPYRACAAAADCGGAACRLFVDHHATQIFHPTFLDHLRDDRLLRFMQWMNTNDTAPAELVDYAEIDDARWLSAPPEIMAELANRMDADLWIDIPHRASNGFVAGFAARLRDRLEEGRSVYVEYSNEVWNAIYPQFLWVSVRGCETYTDLQAGCDDDATPRNGVYCQGHPWPRWVPACQTARIRYFSRRSREVWGLFRDAFGDPSRVVRVLGSQLGQTWMHGEYLAWEDAWRDCDVLATAPYFGVGYGGSPAVAGWTTDQLITDLAQSELPTVIDWIDDDAAFLAASYPGVGLVAYEGGQHLVVSVGQVPDPAQRQAMNLLFDAANRDPRMADLYRALLEGWRASGGREFAHYLNVGVWSEYGRFGALEYQQQPESASPKFLALERFAGDRQCWWPGCAEPPIFAEGFDGGSLAGWSLAFPRD